MTLVLAFYLVYCKSFNVRFRFRSFREKLSRNVLQSYEEVLNLANVLKILTII